MNHPGRRRVGVPDLRRLRVTFAMVFPGQGSQSVGMLRELAAAYPQVEETFAEASAVLGYDLWALAQQGPETELNRTERTQPAMLAAGVAVWRVWQSLGAPRPAVMGGHSLGEYTALVCADALGFRDAVAVVADRGRYMQEAVPQGQGAMAAILGLSDDQVVSACAEAAQGDVVSAANFNSPGQVVIAGTTSAVSRAVDRAKAAGAKRAVLLPVSVPSHCGLMHQAADRLIGRLAGVAVEAPRVPVVHNVDAATHPDPDGIRRALAEQLHRPVRWVDCVRRMAAEGATVLVEAGPGKVLAGLQRRISPEVVALPVLDPDTLRTAVGQLGG
jgi:[acyl-carrier-protein] S-malonyltransferase